MLGPAILAGAFVVWKSQFENAILLGVGIPRTGYVFWEANLGTHGCLGGGGVTKDHFVIIPARPQQGIE